MNKLETSYARLIFKTDTTKRMAFYRKLSSLLRNNFTLVDALGRIENIESAGGTKPREPFAIVMRAWQNGLEAGQSFGDATRGWIPTNETLMIAMGDMSKLHIAVENIVSVVEGSSKIKRALTNAISYPLFLFAMTFGIIVLVGLYLVPPLTEAAGTTIMWRGTAASLVMVSNFAKSFWWLIAGGFLMFGLIVYISLANWSGKSRARFDNIPPYNLYKVGVSVSWLMSLAGMMGSGSSLPVAMKTIADNSSPYLKTILNRALQFIANGDNLGVAMSKTGYNFPNSEIIGDLEIYADMNQFDKNLSQIANDYMNESIRKMENLSGTLNSVGIIAVSIIIGWVVFGTFDMQDQITAALS